MRRAPAQATGRDLRVARKRVAGCRWTSARRPHAACSLRRRLPRINGGRQSLAAPAGSHAARTLQPHQPSLGQPPDTRSEVRCSEARTARNPPRSRQRVHALHPPPSRLGVPSSASATQSRPKLGDHGRSVADEFVCGVGDDINCTNIFVNFGRSRSSCACTSCTSAVGRSVSIHVSVSP
jgi:hypothetical protein